MTELSSRHKFVHLSFLEHINYLSQTCAKDTNAAITIIISFFQCYLKAKSKPLAYSQAMGQVKEVGHRCYVAYKIQLSLDQHCL